jgi:zinc/manganese transport system substrate-binding protein/manganese/iron transport system substrate-binding protein
MQGVRSVGRRLTLLAVAAVMTLLVACAGMSGRPGASPEPSPSGETALQVVVSLPVFVSLVEAVGADRVQVSSLVPGGSDPHTYQPSPRDAQALAEAAVVFVNGLGLEEWLTDLIASAGSEARVVELGEGLATLQDEHGHEESEGTPEAEHAHEHEAGNPHLWLDPDYAIEYVRRIAQTLAELDPEGAATYQGNAERYIAEIEAFDAWAREQVDRIPLERRKLVTFHDAFPYFAEHYGFELVGVIVISPGREPSPRELAQLADLIRQQGVPAIFTEPQFNPKLAETLARETGAVVLELYSDTPPAGEDFLGMMRRNIAHVVEGLAE